MNLRTENYTHQQTEIPQEGSHILTQQIEEYLVVYQAYNPLIAEYAVKHQTFGGNHYSYERMSWIKPNFLWMMYRCGWCEKVNQERTLAIWIKQKDFDLILSEAVHSSFQEDIYKTHANWKETLNTSEVRLQWDPDHDPFGAKEERRAIQLGIKGELLKQFGKQMIHKIEDITDFVKEQKKRLDTEGIDKLIVPVERVYKPMNIEILERIGLS
ncbi:MAG: DUF4291 domain-containing protein [Saprospiraceae bacterium]